MDMETERTWEEETLALIGRLEEDRLRKAEHRLAAARRAVEVVRGQISALNTALEVYRSEHGIPNAELETPTADQIAEYQNRSVKEMLYRWADSHGGQVVMKDATRFLAAAGLFRDETQAAGALYPAVGRAEDFEKVARGVYRRKVKLAADSTPWLGEDEDDQATASAPAGPSDDEDTERPDVDLFGDRVASLPHWRVAAG
jgi:hypothetical protein